MCTCSFFKSSKEQPGAPELLLEVSLFFKKKHDRVAARANTHPLSSVPSDDSTPSLSKDISSALSTVPECFDSEGVFPLEDELRIEPLSLDGLSMLSDPDMVLPDPSVEDTFRSDRL